MAICTRPIGTINSPVLNRCICQPRVTGIVVAPSILREGCSACGSSTPPTLTSSCCSGRIACFQFFGAFLLMIISGFYVRILYVHVGKWIQNSSGERAVPKSVKIHAPLDRSVPMTSHGGHYANENFPTAQADACTCCRTPSLDRCLSFRPLSVDHVTCTWATLDVAAIYKYLRTAAKPG